MKKVLYKIGSALACALLSLVAHAQISNPSQPGNATAGAGLSGAGNVLSVNWGTTSTTTLRGDALHAPTAIGDTTPNTGAFTSLSTNKTITGSANTGAFNYGTLSYSDTNIFASYSTSVNSYSQIINQNTNAGATASADFVVSNNLGTASTYYGNFGINSSGFTGSGSFNLPSATYLSGTSGDLVVGTTTANAIHFVTNNAATDALSITSAGVVNGGPTNLTSIGATTPGTGIFTSIGASSPGTGAFTTLTANTTQPLTNSTAVATTAYVQKTTGIVGTARNVLANLAANGASITYTADEILTETALGGAAYKVSSVSQTINISGAAGPGAMDTGTPPAHGYVCIYEIYNPATNTANLLGLDGSSTICGNVYSGSNMPSGYTASALIGVWPTLSSVFQVAFQRDRTLNVLNNLVNSVTQASATYTPTSISLSTSVPLNAIKVSGLVNISTTGTTTVNLGVEPTANSLGGYFYSNYGSSTTVFNYSYADLPLSSPQNYYYFMNGSGTYTAGFYIIGYTF